MSDGFSGEGLGGLLATFDLPRFACIQSPTTVRKKRIATAAPCQSALWLRRVNRRRCIHLDAERRTALGLLQRLRDCRAIRDRASTVAQPLVGTLRKLRLQATEAPHLQLTCRRRCRKPSVDTQPCGWKLIKKLCRIPSSTHSLIELLRPFCLSFHRPARTAFGPAPPNCRRSSLLMTKSQQFRGTRAPAVSKAGNCAWAR